MALVMKACRDAGKKVVVLDRPNPLGGERWEGAVLESALQGGFAAYYPIPTVHGMTMAELARLFNVAFGIGADLSVVPMKGWARSDLWQDTGLPWIPPSPALVAADQAELYSFLGTLESLNLAVGRGRTNERAFRTFGAPWIKPDEAITLVDRLNRLALPGLRFRTVEWTPSRATYEGKLTRGFAVEMDDFHSVDGLKSLVEVLTTLRGVFGPRLDVSKSDAMLGQRWIRAAIEAGIPADRILTRIRADSAVFSASRAAALLY
jgi:uncharacterized protein YbbC (DUF1343 family)